MPKRKEDENTPITLSERFERYRLEVEEIVIRGIEHPRCEMKRSATISRENLADRLDFVKLIQGIANSHIEGERLLVIGADQKGKVFCTVENREEFDPARVQQVLAKYLYPEPALDVFNSIQASTGENYVLVVINPEQPRPIVTIAEGKSEKKAHFENGDIWIKKGTSLQRATRADVDAMYDRATKRVIDEEAENRARRRFEHFREEFGAVLNQGSIPVPSSDLLIGSKERVARFAEAVIAGDDETRFKMLVEMARERLVDRWDIYEVRGPGLPTNLETWVAEVKALYRDEYIPALDSLVDVGFRVIKFDARSEWLSAILDVLMDAFEESRSLERLKSPNIDRIPGAVSFARPAYEIYIAVRALASFAVARKHFRFLEKILPRFVRGFTIDNQSRTYIPIVFWPFSGSLGLPDMRSGRNQTLWNEHIHAAWGRYFGTYDKFLAAALQLEFVLEFNSYLFEGRHEQQDKSEALRRRLADKNFLYLPDFWVNRLDAIVPIAELFHKFLSGTGLPFDFAVEQEAFSQIVNLLSGPARIAFLGGYLTHLKKWQAEVMMQQQRFPFMFNWTGTLHDAVATYSQSNRPS